MNQPYLSEFNLNPSVLYLNHAGVSPWPLRTADAVRKFAEENARQGSLNYLQWEKTEDYLRAQAQELINAPSKDAIALLKNTSEALSVVAYGLDWNRGDNIVISSQEFPSNRIVWESLSDRGVELRQADPAGAAAPEDTLFALADERTRLISISSVQFSTGLKMDLELIGSFCRDREILFCVDAIQSLGALQFDVQGIDADFVMADGHKWMLGPEGLALFYVHPRARERISLNQFGWHMVEDQGDFDRREWSVAGSARRFECGSPNMLGIHGLSASLSLLLDLGMETVEGELLKRTEYLIEKIVQSRHLKLITAPDPGRYGGIVTFRHSNASSGDLYSYLMSRRIICAPRSGGIRFSPHFYTSPDVIDAAVAAVDGYRP